MGVLVAAVGPTVAAGAAVFKAIADGKSSLAAVQVDASKTAAEASATASAKITDAYSWILWPALGALIWTIVVALYKFVVATSKDREHEELQSPKPLLGPLHVLHEQIRLRKNLQDSADDRRKFRATLYRIDGEYHEQCVSYVGYSSHDPKRVPGPKRRWPNACGLVGKAIRLEEIGPLHAVVGQTIDTADQFVQHLMDSYGYTREQAESCEKMRMSSLVIPIVDASGPTGKPIGVMYCDSSERNFFDKDTQELALASAMGMAKLINVLYS